MNQSEIAERAAREIHEITFQNLKAQHPRAEHYDCESKIARVAAIILRAIEESKPQPDDTRELRKAIKELMDSARVMVQGHKSGREHHPELHLCESCASNIEDLHEDLAEAERVLSGSESKEG